MQQFQRSESNAGFLIAGTDSLVFSVILDAQRKALASVPKLRH